MDNKVVRLHYEYYRTPLRSIERPFILIFRQPNSDGGVFKRALTYPTFATEREARREVARMNMAVRPCETETCKGTVYPHESETREYAGTAGLCEACFDRVFETQAGLGARAAAGRAR